MDKKLIKLFADTFLEGFFELEEDKYLEPALKKKSTEVVVGRMSDAEKRVFTLVSMSCMVIQELSLEFKIDSIILNNFLNSGDEALLEEILDDVELEYETQGLEIPWDNWDIFIQKLCRHQKLIDFLDALVYTRMLPKYFCFKPIFRSGFLIVKDGFEVIEDCCSSEDNEKIVNQNFPFN